MNDPLLPMVIWMPGISLREVRLEIAAAAVKHYKSEYRAAKYLEIDRKTLWRWLGRKHPA